MADRRATEKERTAAGITPGLLRGLIAEANRSPSGESYQELTGGPGFRLAIAVTPHDGRAPRYSLVVLIDSTNRAASRGPIPRGAFDRIEAALAARGYVSSHLDSGWKAHERSFPRSRLAAEWRFLLVLFTRTDATPGGRA